MEIKRITGIDADFFLEGVDTKKETKEFLQEMRNVFNGLFEGKDLKTIDINLPYCGVYHFDRNVYGIQGNFMLEMHHQFQQISEKSTPTVRPNVVKVRQKEGELSVSFYHYTGYATADVKEIIITYCESKAYDNLIEDLKDEGFTPEMIEACKKILYRPEYLYSKDEVIDWLKDYVLADVEETIQHLQAKGLHINKSLKEQDIANKLNELKSAFGTSNFCNYCYINDDAVAVIFLNTVIRIFQRVPVTTYKFA